MTMNPIEDFIPRNLSPDVERILNEFSSWIDEIVNFGSNLVSWDIQNAQGEEEVLPPILFLRNFLEYNDACSILIKHSSTEPCNSLLRTMLENFLCLEYLLEKETQQRSLCFLFWNANLNRQILLSMDGKSGPYLKLEKAFKNDKVFYDQKPFVQSDIELRIANNHKLLNNLKYKPILDEYDKTKKRLKRKPVWYSLYDGPENVEKLANRLGFNAFYEILYRQLSSSTHGTSIIQGKISKNPLYGVDIYQIRMPSNAQTITTMCFNLSIYLFKTYITKRLPGKLLDYTEWINSISHIFKALETRNIIKLQVH